MSDRTFEIRILPQYCKGCALCVEACGEGKLYINPRPDRQGVQKVAAREEVDCTGCLKCATICPDAAIEIYRVAPKARSGSSQRARQAPA